MANGKEYFQIAKEQLDQQRQNMDTLNAKVNTLLVICGVFIVFIGEIVSRSNSILDGFLLGLGTPLILTAMIILLISYRVVDWEQGPNVDRVLFDLKQETEIEEFYIIAIESISEWYSLNEKTEQKKSKRINSAGKLLMWGVFINIIGVIIFLFLLDAPSVVV